MKMNKHNENERGIAAILTIIFFVLIISVITVGFVRLASLESRQSLEDSLSKSALNAAYSGVNDGKRALLYCLENNTRPECDQASPSGINNPSCRGFFNNVDIRNNLGIADPDADPNTKGGVPVADPAANERYTCVLIKNDTWDVTGPLKVDTLKGTEIIPLRGVSPFSQVRISWNQARTSVNLSGMTYNSQPGVANYRATDAYNHFVLGPVFEYQPNWPATLRTSLFSHQNNRIEYFADGSTNIAETTAFLYPRSTSSTTSDVRPLGALATRQSVGCRSGGVGYGINPAAGEGTYSCQMTFKDLPDSSANTMYLQLTNFFNDTDYAVELLDSAGAPVRFDDVSPLIDSTGAVENVFKRVQVRLRYQGYGLGGSTPILPNALDIGSGICKNFAVTNDAADFRQSCLP